MNEIITSKVNLFPKEESRKERKKGNGNEDSDGIGLLLRRIEIYTILSKYQVFSFLALSETEDPYRAMQLIHNIKSSIKTDDQKFGIYNAIKDADSDPRKVVFLCNLPLVVSIAKEYSGIPLEDAISEGCFGLDKAIERFDRKRGTAFSTFATPCIRTAIEDGQNRNSSIYIPINIKKGARRAYAIGMEHRRNNMKITREELTEKLKTESPAEKKSNIDLMVETAGSGVLAEPRYLYEEQNGLVADFYLDRRFDPERIVFDRLEIRERIRLEFEEMEQKHLTKQEKIVMGHRKGLFDGVKRTLEEIAEIIGLGRERIRQLEKSGLRKMGKERVDAGISVSELRKLKRKRNV